jgi:hypothetical protein
MEALNTVEGRERIADRLGLSRKTILALVALGLPIQITHAKNGSRWVCDWDAVRAWMSVPHNRQTIRGAR